MNRPDAKTTRPVDGYENAAGGPPAVAQVTDRVGGAVARSQPAAGGLLGGAEAAAYRGRQWLVQRVPTHPVTALASPRSIVSYTVIGMIAAGVVANPYAVATLARILAVGLLAVSVAVLTGWAGLPSLGQVAPFAVGAYTTALLARAGVTVGVVQMGAATAAAVLFAVLTGVAVIRTRGTAFLMVTLAVAELTAAAATRWSSLTGGSDGLAGIPAVRPVWGAPALANDWQVYWYVLGVTAAVVAITVAVLRSPAGLLLNGIRDHEVRMRACGHPVGAYLLAAYTAAGAIAGVGGALLVTVARYISPADVGFDTAALVLLAVIIGGATSIGGAFAGAALVVGARDWLAGPWPGHTPLLLGAMLIVAVYLLLRGLSGLAHRLRDPRRRREVQS